MNPKIGISFGLALLMVIISTMLLLGMLSANPVSASVTSANVSVNPNEARSIGEYTIVFTTPSDLAVGDTITVTFNTSTAVPSSIASSSIKLKASLVSSGGNNQLVNAASVTVSGRAVTITVPDMDTIAGGDDRILANASITITITQSAGIQNPNLAKSNYTLTVKTTKDPIAVTSAAYLITTDVDVTPTSVEQGEMITVSGSGFNPFSNMTVTIDSTIVQFLVSTDASGTFAGIVLVPDLPSGVTTLTAADSLGVNGSTSLTIIGPVLSVDVSSIDFGSTNTERFFTIRNTSVGTLSWSISDTATWLTITPPSGTANAETDTITATADRRGLSQGDHPATITVTTNGGTALISVTMTQPPPPSNLIVSSDFIDFGSAGTESFFTIRNTGGGTLSWSISDSAAWLTLTPSLGTAGAETENITAIANRSGLPQGGYSANIIIASDGGTASIRVTLTQPPPPSNLTVSTNFIDFGTASTDRLFTIRNSGGGTLSWSISDSAAWLTLTPSSGTVSTETDNITAIAGRSGLSQGDYDATITVTTGVGTASIRVTLTQPPPQSNLTVSTDFIDFGTANTDRLFTIRNNGGGTLSWSISDSAAWLTLTPSSGTASAETDNITAKADRSSLLPGGYSANINISSDGGNAIIVATLTQAPSPTPTPTPSPTPTPRPTATQLPASTLPTPTPFPAATPTPLVLATPTPLPMATPSGPSSDGTGPSFTEIIITGAAALGAIVTLIVAVLGYLGVRASRRRNVG